MRIDQRSKKSYGVDTFGRLDIISTHLVHMVMEKVIRNYDEIQGKQYKQIYSAIIIS